MSIDYRNMRASTSWFGWVLIVAWFTMMLIGAVLPQLKPALAFSQLLLLTAFAFIHGRARYSMPALLVLLAIAMTVANLLENLSIETGFPFGIYHHTEIMGPKLFNVPLIVGVSYFCISYIAWIVANLLLDEPDRESGTLARLAPPVVAMFIATGWDACVDPIAATVNRSWIYHHGGGYFGVPLTNFFGWMLTIFVLLQLFSLYLAKRPEHIRPGQPRHWWAQPAVLFGLMSLEYPLNLLMLPHVTVTDQTGTAWRSADVYEATTIVSLFTMLFIATISLIILARRRSTTPTPVLES